MLFISGWLDFLFFLAWRLPANNISFSYFRGIYRRIIEARKGRTMESLLA